MKNKGFTLIELMITIAIMVILASVGAVLYNNMLTRANEGVTQARLGDIRSALSIFYAQSGGYYPAAIGSSTDGSLADAGEVFSPIVAAGSGSGSGLGPNTTSLSGFIGVEEPKGSGTYYLPEAKVGNITNGRAAYSTTTADYPTAAYSANPTPESTGWMYFRPTFTRANIGVNSTQVDQNGAAYFTW